MKTFGGKVLFLDRADINTDEIIPAKYLIEITKEAMKPHLLEDLKLAEFDPRHDITGRRVVVTRENFGCGSSREHAPWAFEVNDITAIIAPSFARIFRQNMYNCGMLALELPEATIEGLFSACSGKETIMNFDLAAGTITVAAEGYSETIPFALHGFDAALIQAGGWVDYADSHY